jgi:hypothetical protein
MFRADVDIIICRVTCSLGKSKGGRFRNETLSQEIMGDMIGWGERESFSGRFFGSSTWYWYCQGREVMTLTSDFPNSSRLILISIQ